MSDDEGLRPRVAHALWRFGPELCAAWPLLILGQVHHLAWLASTHLGRWPDPSRDDPRSISGIVTALHTLDCLLFTVWPVAAAAGLLATVAQGRRGAGRTLVRFALLAATNALFLHLARSDPTRAFAWFLD